MTAGGDFDFDKTQKALHENQEAPSRAQDHATALATAPRDRKRPNPLSTVPIDVADTVPTEHLLTLVPKRRDCAACETAKLKKVAARRLPVEDKKGHKEAETDRAPLSITNNEKDGKKADAICWATDMDRATIKIQVYR